MTVYTVNCIVYTYQPILTVVLIRAGQTQTISHFQVLALLTRRHFADAMGEDVTVIEKTRVRKTRLVTDAKFRIC